MSDWLWSMIAIVVTVPIWGTALWELYQFRIRPHLIPHEEINQIVAEMMRRPDPQHAALLEEEAAWHRGDSFEQGKWRRVRKALQHLSDQSRTR